MKKLILTDTKEKSAQEQRVGMTDHRDITEPCNQREITLYYSLNINENNLDTQAV